MDKTKEVWRQCDAVCFDVDSTLVVDEGLDELAKFLGKGDEIIALTNQAMGGQMTFRESFSKRLDILKPSRADVESFLEEDKLSFTPGLQELVKVLQAKNVDVYLVSGGIHSLIRPLATKLHIPVKNIYANSLQFNVDGSYDTFDAEQPTSAAGGKTKVAGILKTVNKYTNLVFIGDGVTDAEACPPADAFIGFGGNVVRDSVKELAKWYVYDMQELITELECQRTPSA